MSDFKGRRFPTDIILVCVRWYCKYGVSYRDLEEMMSERGVMVDHTTIFRWVQRYAPLMEKRIRWCQRYTDASWRVDETYVKVAGVWAYLYRAVDKNGDTIDFMLSPRRTAKSAKRFLGKALKLREDCPPETINTDRNETYGKAIRTLNCAGVLNKDVRHRQVKYLNNQLEADHGGLKRVIKPTRGFKSLPTASATIKGFEVMRMIRKGQCLMLESGAAGEVRFVNRLFRLAA
jgi:transposase-like protein